MGSNTNTNTCKNTIINVLANDLLQFNKYILCGEFCYYLQAANSRLLPIMKFYGWSLRMKTWPNLGWEHGTLNDNDQLI